LAVARKHERSQERTPQLIFIATTVAKKKLYNLTPGLLWDHCQASIDLDLSAQELHLKKIKN
jgi:hypothetical protein